MSGKGFVLTGDVNSPDELLTLQSILAECVDNMKYEFDEISANDELYEAYLSLRDCCAEFVEFFDN